MLKTIYFHNKHWMSTREKVKRLLNRGFTYMYSKTK